MGVTSSLFRVHAVIVLVFINGADDKVREARTPSSIMTEVLGQVRCSQAYLRYVPISFLASAVSSPWLTCILKLRMREGEKGGEIH